MGIGKKRGLIFNTKNTVILSAFIIAFVAFGAWFILAQVVEMNPGTTTSPQYFNDSESPVALGNADWRTDDLNITFTLNVTNTDSNSGITVLGLFYPNNVLENNVSQFTECNGFGAGGTCNNESMTRVSAGQGVEFARGANDYLDASASEYINITVVLADENVSTNWTLKAWDENGTVIGTFYSNFTIDSVLPEVNFSVSGITPEVTWLTSVHGLGCDAADSVSGVNLTSFTYWNSTDNSTWDVINATGISNTTYYWNSTAGADEEDSLYYVRCNATDNVGNQVGSTDGDGNAGASGSDYVFIGIDSVKPSIGNFWVASDTNLFASGDTVTFNSNVTDGFLLNVTLINVSSSGGLNGYEWNLSMFETQGAEEPIHHNNTGGNFSLALKAITDICAGGAGTEFECEVNLTAQDNASNTKTSSVRLSLDDQVPRVVFPTINLTMNATRDNETIFNLTVNVTDWNVDNISSVTVMNDSIEDDGGNAIFSMEEFNDQNLWTAYDFNLRNLTNTSDASNATVVVRFNATDNAGNYNDSITLTIFMSDEDAIPVTIINVTDANITSSDTWEVYLNLTGNRNISDVRVGYGYTQPTANLTDLGGGLWYFSTSNYSSAFCPQITDASCDVYANITTPGSKINDTESHAVYLDDVIPTVAAAGSNISDLIFSRYHDVNITANVSDGNWYTYFSDVKVGNASIYAMNLTPALVDGDYNWSFVLSNNTQYNVSSLCGLDALADGEYNCTITFNATDAAGNYRDSVSAVVWIDDLVPRVTSLAISNDTHSATDSQFNLTLVITDLNVSGDDHNAASTGAVAVYNSTGDVLGEMLKDPSVTDGWYLDTLTAGNFGTSGDVNLKVNATDGADNVNNSETLVLHLDSTAPDTRSVDVSPAISRTTDTLYFSAAIEDNLNVTKAWLVVNDTDNNNLVFEMGIADKGTNATANYSNTPGAMNLSEDTYWFYVVGEDNAGNNESTLSAENKGLFTVDNSSVAPLIVTSYPSYQTFNTTTVNVNVTVDTSTAVCQYSVNDTDFGSNDMQTMDQSGTLHYADVNGSLNEGLNMLFVRCARDSAGRSAMTSSKVVMFNVDTNPAFGGWVSPLYGGGQTNWRFFYAPNTFLSAVSSLNSNYNVSRVVNQSQINYTVFYGYNTSSTSWQAYYPYDEGSSSLLDLAEDTPYPYWLNATNTSEVEIRII